MISKREVFLKLSQDKHRSEKLGFHGRKETTGPLFLSAKQIQMQAEYTPWVFESTMISSKTVLEIARPSFLSLYKDCWSLRRHC